MVDFEGKCSGDDKDGKDGGGGAELQESHARGQTAESAPEERRKQVACTPTINKVHALHKVGCGERLGPQRPLKGSSPVPAQWEAPSGMSTDAMNHTIVPVGSNRTSRAGVLDRQKCSATAAAVVVKWRAAGHRAFRYIHTHSYTYAMKNLSAPNKTKPR